MRIKKTPIIQYFLIYLMYVTPGSCLFAKYLKGNMKYYALLGLYGFLFFRKAKYRSGYALRFIILFTISVLFTRIYTGGGAGINSLFQYLVCVLCTQMAIYSDKEHYLTRWIKFSCLFSAISIVFWAAFYAVPKLVTAYPGVYYLIQIRGSVGYEKYWHGKGLLLYSWVESHPTRNCGLFTEPGVYQIVLNMTLYILLFWQDKLEFSSSKEYRRYVAITLVALVSCQSTTGYLGMIMILTVFFFSGRAEKKFRGIKGFMVGAVSLGLVVLLGDYAARGEESILYSQFIYKLFGSEGGLDVSEGTGQYRAGTLVVCLDIMANYPLGVGYDRFTMMKEAYAGGLVASSLLLFPAVFGIFPWLILLGLLLIPVIMRQKPMVAFLYIFLFVNTTLAQTDLLYPGFFMIPVYLVGVPNKRKEKGSQEKVPAGAAVNQSMLNTKPS